MSDNKPNTKKALEEAKKVYIKGLEKFYGRYVPFIHDMPNDYTPKQRKKLINYLETFIPSEQSEIVIETGTDYTAYSYRGFESLLVISVITGWSRWTPGPRPPRARGPRRRRACPPGPRSAPP